MPNPNIEYINPVLKGFKTSLERVSNIKDPNIKHTMMLEIVRSILDISVKLSIADFNEDIEKREVDITEERMRQERTKRKDQQKDQQTEIGKDGNKNGDNIFENIVNMEKDLKTTREIVENFGIINQKIGEELDQMSKYIQESELKYDDEDDDDDSYEE